MKFQKRIMLILLSGCLLIGLIIPTMFLNPGWAYPMSTSFDQIEVFHSAPLEANWSEVLDSVQHRLTRSDIYDESLTMKLCLDDGSAFPAIVERVAGPSFAFAGVNVIIMESQHDLTAGKAHRGELSYDLVSLITHEALHCCEYHHQGFWGANPMAGHPVWKWEGYAELLGRGTSFPGDSTQIADLWKASKSAEWITLPDSSHVHHSYLRFALLSHLCLQECEGNFVRFLADTRTEEFWASVLDNELAEE